jgi:hypothetical protein
MTISMYQASVPIFIQSLNALSNILDKAAAQAVAKKFDSAALLTARLYPDMFPFSKQVQLACDFAKNTAARLAGAEPVKFEDTETSFEQLMARVARTIDLLKTFGPEQIDGSEERDITITVGGQPRTFKGLAYLQHFALPNFFFHDTTAYAILRHNGIEIGKRDFVGAS